MDNSLPNKIWSTPRKKKHSVALCTEIETSAMEVNIFCTCIMRRMSVKPRVNVPFCKLNGSLTRHFNNIGHEQLKQIETSKRFH